MITDPEYLDAVIQLHRIAAMIENKIGIGQLSQDLRNCADRLHELTKEVST